MTNRDRAYLVLIGVALPWVDQTYAGFAWMAGLLHGIVAYDCWRAFWRAITIRPPKRLVRGW